MISTQNYCGTCGRAWDRVHDRCPVGHSQGTTRVHGPYRIPKPTSATDTLRANAEADVADLLARLIGLAIRSVKQTRK